MAEEEISSRSVRQKRGCEEMRARLVEGKKIKGISAMFKILKRSIHPVPSPSRIERSSVG